MVWIVKGAANSNELVIEASLSGWQIGFMTASTITKHRGNARRWGGQVAADAYCVQISSMVTGAAAEEHKPGSLAWLEEHAPWHAEPLYDDSKRGQTIVGGKSRLVLKDADTALTFKLTFG